MSADHGGIASALTAYFDGFYEGDVDKLKGIFHPACHLYSAPAGAVIDDDMDAVYARVGGRISGAERGDAKEDAIVTIDQSGPECAFAKVMIALGDKRFTDYLTLLRLGGRWQIITKTFTAEPRPEVPPLTSR